ncbi:glycosyltransferase family 2 protein [Amycolatopsis orientalis]|uniref:glycosyltransferase family 2 protein n=1 Tax=Amycolatopsis orientalis TaxID=31958 RepID=UPI0004060A65|nr:glycosyltransferase family 2 protein [Amycolatopsis orientalis]
MFSTVIEVFTYISSAVFITYVCAIVVPFVNRRKYAEGNADEFEWHIFVPCRDEEAVIGDTIFRLRATFPDAHVWVIDDDSHDGTARVVTALMYAAGDPDPQLHLVRRRPPQARTGKGDALNAAYQELDAWLGKHLSREKIIVGVVDADGVLAPNCLDVCAADHLFGNGAVGAVQIEVQMLNQNVEPDWPSRPKRWAALKLVQLQDMEFRTAISAVQHSRAYAGTVAMGGNGQFTRMSALHSIARGTGQPWRGLLLEDYELGLHLLMAGWRTAATSDTHVSQEGLYSLRRFITQRTRWGQGTMQCIRYLPAVWRSSYFGAVGVAEVGYYLVQPWLQLVGIAVYPIPFMLLLWQVISDPSAKVTAVSGGGWLMLVLFAVLATGPFVIWGFIYQFQCRRQRGLFTGLGMGLGFALYVCTFYVTSLRAVWRIIRGQHGWAKTRRNAEAVSGREIAIEV